MQEQKIKVVVIGCGDRATVYCEEGVNQLHKMESLIAESNEHTFLKGKNLNETR